MITESVLTWVIHLIGLFVSPIFDTAYSAMGIESSQARLLVPSPIFFVVSLYVQYTVVLMPIALAWWVWRQVKA